MPTAFRPHAAPLRLLVALLAGLLGVTGALAFAGGADGDTGHEPLPRAHCGPGARPETGRQGRVPQRDYDSGRVRRGYRCNTRPVSHHGQSGGFKVRRYTDEAGHTCAFYDSTLVFPRDVVYNISSGLGVTVLDMSDPSRPRQTDSLVSPAMQSPHESLLLNKRRGLLVASLGTAATYPGVLDVYDVRTDCRHPRLLSSTPSGVLGHESGFSPDGRTFWTSSASAGLVAIDLDDPRAPHPIFTRLGVTYHGLRLSPDGDTMYVADIGGKPHPTTASLEGAGLTILDVSEVQDRVPDPDVPVLSHLTWDNVSIPQSADPFTRNGHKYVLEMDEYTDLLSAQTLTAPRHAPVGAGRIINVDDPRNPFVVSDIRLEVHQPSVHGGAQYDDPGASFQAQGYAGHYCSLPRYRNPRIVGCSMIASGLRLIDIRDVHNPREVAYFNKPTLPGTRQSFPTREGAYAMSAPAWDPEHRQVWYTDANNGFWAVRLTNGVGRLLRR